jgi:hypothetical protein
MAHVRSGKATGKRKSASRVADFIALPDAEKERQAAAFNREFVADTARPLTAAQRKLWQKAKRKVGRPRKGEGVKTIALSVERGLLKRADAMAKRRKLTRAALVAEALEAALSSERPTSKAG